MSSDYAKICAMMGQGRRVRKVRRGGNLFRTHRIVPFVGPAFTYGGQRKRRVRRRGGNIFSKIGNWFKGAANTVYQKAIKPAGNFIKDNKLVSKGLSFIPGVGGKVGSVIAGQLGVGRRRIRRRKGGSLMSILKSGHNFVKKHSLASKLAHHVGFSKVAKALKSVGYGRTKKRVVRRRGRGPLLRAAAAGIAKLRSLARLAGYGRKAPRRARRTYRRR